jgi:phage shock protein A
MSLMERVTALIRANLNELVERAEDPELMLKQVIVDMENQLIQVKTQVAIALADEHLLVKKQQENLARQASWMRKAELAVDKHDDGLARAALERAEACRQMEEALDEHLSDQRTQTESLRSALRKLEHKLAEARAKSDLMAAEHRRARTAKRATEAGAAIRHERHAFDRMRREVQHGDAESAAAAQMAEETLEEQFSALERNERIDQLLSELKAKRRT